MPTTKTQTTLSLMLLVFLVLSCVDSPVDPTLLRQGISGITYTDESGSLIGPIDYQDWTTPFIEMSPAFPNPTKDTIHFRFRSDFRPPRPEPSRTFRVGLFLVDDNGRTLEGLIFQIRYDGETIVDLSLSDYPDGLYRIRYVASDLSYKHGDIWKTSAADAIRRNLNKP